MIKIQNNGNIDRTLIHNNNGITLKYTIQILNIFVVIIFDPYEKQLYKSLMAQIVAIQIHLFLKMHLQLNLTLIKRNAI